MGKLTHISSGTEHNLTATSLVSRNPQASVPVPDRRVSNPHASFHWRGEGWELRDLCSRNGTFVNHRKLEPGEAVWVFKGSQIAFGSMDLLFTMVADTPPRALAHAENGTIVCADDEGWLALPSAEQPDIWVSEYAGRWFIESEDGPHRTVQDGALLQAGAMAWRLELPVVLEKTLMPEEARSQHMDEIGLRFTVARNDDFVGVDVLYGRHVIRLRSRAHHHLLLALARKRQADQMAAGATGMPASEHGWMDVRELCNILQATQNNLALDIFRARRQLGEEAGILDARLLIERRRGAQIRLNVTRIEILP
jgi:hypothetical protein